MITTYEAPAPLQRLFVEVDDVAKRFGPSNYSRSLAGIPTVMNKAAEQAILETHLKWQRIPRHVLIKCNGRLELRPDVYGRITAKEANERALSVMIKLRTVISRMIALLNLLPKDETLKHVLSDLSAESGRLMREEETLRRRNVLGA
jgi:hypothetical protein